MTVQLLLALSLLVVIHEFGHYLAAKAFGVRVKKFYLFFDFPMFFTAPTFALFRAKKVNGKWIFSWFSRNAPKEYEEDETSTEWGIGYFPLGGYCAIDGMVEKIGDGRIYDSRLSNGPIESINRKAKDLKRLGRGFRNFEHFRNRFLYATRSAPVLNAVNEYNTVLYFEESEDE